RGSARFNHVSLAQLGSSVGARNAGRLIRHRIPAGACTSNMRAPPAKDLSFRSPGAKRRRREGTRSPLRLILVGFMLEAVYIVGFVRPYKLVAWLPSTGPGPRYAVRRSLERTLLLICGLHVSSESMTQTVRVA